MGDVPPMLIDVPPTPTDEEARAHFAEVRQRSGKITVDGDLGCAREVLAGPFASLNEAIGAATMINRCGDRILPIVQPARGGEHA